MAVNKLRLTSLKLLKNYSYYSPCSVCQKHFYCTSKSDDEKVEADKKFGFAEFSEKQEDFLKPEEKPAPPVETFVSLLRKSKFVDVGVLSDIGNPVGKVVIGEIYHVVDNDLYIDFGWKLPTVCQAPKKNKELYIPGAKVKLLINDLELTTKFLSSKDYVTLNEADCTLLGLSDFSK